MSSVRHNLLVSSYSPIIMKNLNNDWVNDFIISTPGEVDEHSVILFIRYQFKSLYSSAWIYFCYSLLVCVNRDSPISLYTSNLIKSSATYNFEILFPVAIIIPSFPPGLAFLIKKLVAFFKRYRAPSYENLAKASLN
jgi:hypothetical protein